MLRALSACGERVSRLVLSNDTRHRLHNLPRIKAVWAFLEELSAELT
jgi:hypothetical protein